MKVCKTCKRSKEEKEFWRNRSAKDGLQPSCAECSRIAKNAHPVCPICGGPTRQGRCAPCLASYGTKWCPLCKTLRPLDEFKRNKTRTGGRDSWCKSCRKSKTDWAALYEKDKEKIAAYRKKNKKKIAEQGAASYKVRREKRLAQHRAWRKANPGKWVSYSAKRRASKLQATPPWLTAKHLKEIEGFYRTAGILTRTTKVRFVVDHIVPLRGKNVRGLHVPWNLQVITQQENLQKAGKLLGVVDTIS